MEKIYEVIKASFANTQYAEDIGIAHDAIIVYFNVGGIKIELVVKQVSGKPFGSVRGIPKEVSGMDIAILATALETANKFMTKVYNACVA